jgi:hypothetical protein
MIKEQLKKGGSVRNITDTINEEIIKHNLNVELFSKTIICDLINKYKLRNK